MADNSSKITSMIVTRVRVKLLKRQGKKNLPTKQVAAAASGGSCQKREWLLLGPRWGETHPCVTAARVIPRRVGPATGLAKSLAHGGRHQVGVSSSQKHTKQNTDWLSDSRGF